MDDLDDCAALAAERDRDDARTIALGMQCDTCGTSNNAYYRDEARAFRCDPCAADWYHRGTTPAQER